MWLYLRVRRIGDDTSWFCCENQLVDTHPDMQSWFDLRHLPDISLSLDAASLVDFFQRRLH